MTREHVHPLSRGGKKSDTTLPCCKECNAWRDNMTLLGWAEEIKIKGYRRGYTAGDLKVILKNISRIKRVFIAE